MSAATPATEPPVTVEPAKDMQPGYTSPPSDPPPEQPPTDDVPAPAASEPGTAGRPPADSGLPNPSRLWYLGHLFFWVITGLVCYVLYKDKNPAAARRHLLVSIVLHPAIAVALLISVMVLVPDADPFGDF